MSIFTDFYGKAVETVNNQPSLGKNTPKTAGKKIRCKYCLSEAHVHEPTGIALCPKCGSTFAVSEKYGVDIGSVEKMSGKQLYDAAFYDGKIVIPFLELSAKKGHLEALLLLANYWDGKGDKAKTEAYYKIIAEQGHEGKAAWILYRFRQEPQLPEYEDLLIELDRCLMKNFFYTVDPSECLDVFREREERYLQYCIDAFDEEARRENEKICKAIEEQSHFVEKDDYVDDDFYEKYYLPYINGQKTDDGADWNGLSWTADHTNAIGM